MNHERFYPEHVQYRQRGVEYALAESNYRGLLIHSGQPMPYFADDQYAPFRPTPHFSAWLPARGPGYCLMLRTGQRPRLLHYATADYWYEPSALDRLQPHGGVRIEDNVVITPDGHCNITRKYMP